MRVPKVDKDLGMLTYLTETGRLPGRLRERPSDFVVDEVLGGVRASEALRREVGGNGRYLLLVGARIGMDTPSLARLISKKYGGRVRYSGLKDKRSVAFQYFTVDGRRKFTLRRRGLLIKPVGRRARHIRRGEADGNLFIVTVRGVKELEVPEKFPNFFSYQRFGLSRPYNHEIGRALVKRELREAAEMMVRQRHLASLPERIDLQTLSSRVGRDVIRLYVHSYQSYLFNVLLSKRIEEDMLSPEEGDYVLRDGWILAHPEKGDLLLPLPGGFTKLRGGWLQDSLDSLLRDEGVSLEDFLFKEVPEVSGFGDFRKALESPRGVKVYVREGVTLTFFLESGSYATSLLREAIKPEDPLSQGFA